MTDARVLVVAHTARIGDKWGDYLQSAGYGVCGPASSAGEALHQIQESRPDLVLIDLNGADELDGVDVARQITSRNALPVLYAAQLAGDDLFRRALASKPDGFVFDPSRPQELHAAIEIARQNFRARQEAGDRTASLMQLNEELGVAREQLREHVAELRVAEEELRAQNEELLAAEDKLHAERERYLDLFQFAPDAYLVTDLQGFILEANRAAGLLLGREEALLVNKPLVLLVAAGDREAFFAQVSQALAAREPVHWAAQLETGEHHAFRAALTVAARPVPGRGPGEGAILRWFIRDITAHTEASRERERLLHENRGQREFLERLVDSAPVAIGVVYGPDHRLQLCNAAFQALPFLAGRAVLAEPLAEVLGQASPAILELLGQAYRRGTVVGLREEVLNDGPGCAPTTCYWDIDGVPLPGPEGQVDRVLLLINQVTAQVAARQQIEELAARAEQRAEELGAVFGAMADPVVVYDAATRAKRANASAVSFYGFDLAGKTHAELAGKLAAQSPAGRPVPVEDLPVPRALRGEVVQGEHLIFCDAAGRERIIRASAAPVCRGARITGAVATFHDITEEVGAQQDRDRLVAILEATPDMVFMFSPGGKILYMNQAARGARGLAGDAPLDGLTFGDMLPAAAGAVVEEQGIPTALREGIWRGQAAISDADGREIPVSKVIVAHRGQDGQVDYLSSIARDVTERQRILAALAGERARLRAVIDNAPEGIVVADEEGKVVLANPAAERLYARPVLHGLDYDSLASLGLRRRDGSPLDPRDLLPARPVPAGENLGDAALRITWPNGQERDLMANSAPIRDVEGRVTGSVTIFRDVTEQVQAEENLRRFSDRLKILYDIDQAILAAQSPEEIFPPVLERLAHLIPCCYAGILLGTAAGDKLQLRLGDENGGYEVVDDVGLTVADLANHGVRQAGDLQLLPFPSPVERLLRDRGLRAYAGAPVLAGNNVLGFLFIGSDEVHGLHPESMEIVGEVARSLALAIQHDLLRAELVRHGDQLADSLREKELMLQEIHHRVKNNLQIISSLLDMEATGFQDANVVQALQDSRNRVKIMALIHERLYQSAEVGSVAAPGYVRTITSYLFGVHRPTSGPVDLELKVQDVFLDINTAIPLGLILNELVSNALKYAFAGDEKERHWIRIGFQVADDGMVLEVGDNGDGLPDEVNWQMPRTLGLRLVRVLTEQLRGRLELDRQDGTTFRIAFPQPRNRAPGR